MKCLWPGCDLPAYNHKHVPGLRKSFEWLNKEKIMDNNGSWCQVWGPHGQAIAFNPLDPTPDMVDIETIAHALAMKCRFNGHVKEFFSVAQHSVMVSNFCDENDALWGLLHDGDEAYLIDVPRPLKRSKEFEGYRLIEKNIQQVIMERFELPLDMPKSVFEADDLMLQLEWRDNLQPKIQEIFTALVGALDDNYQPLRPVGPVEAEALFMNRFAQLMRRRGRT